MECGGCACLVLVRILLRRNGLKHRSEIIEVKVRYWKVLLLQGLVYGSGGVSWRGYVVLVLLVVERIGGRMCNCRVLIQESVEFMFQKINVEFMVGILISREEIEVGMVVLSPGGGKKYGRGGAGRVGVGRRRICERRLGRRRIVDDI